MRIRLRGEQDRIPSGLTVAKSIQAICAWRSVRPTSNTALKFCGVAVNCVKYSSVLPRLSGGVTYANDDYATSEVLRGVNVTGVSWGDEDMRSTASVVGS